MPLSFYYGSGSPYAWRVWRAREHKGIAYELRTMSFSAGDLRKPEFLAINPRGRVPAIDDDGFALYESVAIVEYLDEKYGGPKLFLGDGHSRARVRRLVQESDQYYAIAMEKLVDEVLFKPQAEWDAAVIAAGRETLAKELAMWERLISGEWLAGGTVSAAALGVLDPTVRIAFAGAPPGVNYRNLLVLIELKGGNDGLNTVVPYTDPSYFALRPKIAIARDAVVLMAWTAPGPAIGQTTAPPRWNPPRLGDGQPDMQGHWISDAVGAAHSVEDGRDPADDVIQNRIGERNPIVVVDPPDRRIPYQQAAAARRTQLLRDMFTPTQVEHEIGRASCRERV